MLYDTERDEIHVLNPTAAFVLDLYRQGEPAEEIERVLREAFDVPENSPVAEDVRKCMADLVSKDLVEPRA